MRGQRIIAVVAAVVCVAAAALITWRVLGPAEVRYAATDPYPPVSVRAPGVTGRTTQAPLIVDGRIRVFAAKRQVRADAPVDAKGATTARWSYRRWPQQVSGVVAAGTTVVTRWSDGLLVALDARTGQVTWRADGPPAGGYTGHRTGAATVWAPEGLHVSGGTVLVRGDGRIAALDAATGQQRWTADCAGPSFTTTSGHVACGPAVHEATTGRPVTGRNAPEATTGRPVTGWNAPATPLGCDVARSACPAFRDTTGAGWLTTGDRPTRARALDDPDTTAVTGTLALTTEPGAVVARSPLTGAELWRHPADDPTVLGAGPSAVHVLTGGPERTLISLDPSSGAVRTSFRPAFGTEKTTWIPGRWQVTDGYLAIERLTDPDPAAHDHYFTVETVLIAAVP